MLARTLQSSDYLLPPRRDHRRHLIHSMLVAAGSRYKERRFSQPTHTIENMQLRTILTVAVSVSALFVLGEFCSEISKLASNLTFLVM